MRRWLQGLWMGMLLCCTIAGRAAPTQGYKVVRTYPHSTSSFTEGFLYLHGLFYEGTGEEGRSALMAIQPETGKPVRTAPLAPAYFGEGIVDWGPYVYEWTWTSHLGFVYERSSFRLLKTLRYDGEGWGMTHDPRQIITSNGTPQLTFRDPATFKPVREITVHDGPVVLSQLNELEYVKGEIFANIWHDERLVRISPADGHVLGYVDLHGLRPASTLGSAEAVLNGIAYDASEDRLFVTGKLWPAVFEIRLTEARK